MFYESMTNSLKKLRANNIMNDIELVKHLNMETIFIFINSVSNKLTM